MLAVKECQPGDLELHRRIDVPSAENLRSRDRKENESVVSSQLVGAVQLDGGISTATHFERAAGLLEVVDGSISTTRFRSCISDEKRLAA